MSVPSMKSIEYNAWMSLMEYIGGRIPEVGAEYGLSGVTIDVIPAYPRDLTKLNKPSIIVQRIHTSQEDVGIGGTLGTYSDGTGEYDVYGKVHNIIYQINVDSDSNTELSKLTSMLCEGILGRTMVGIYDEVISIMNYTVSLDNPPVIGRMDIIGDIDITPLSSNVNNDYIDMIRVEMETVQSIVDMSQGMIDLSKDIKWTQHIII